ncbi:MAG: STAS domain-containing protein [Chthoniobacterales bacterium]
MPELEQHVVNDTLVARPAGRLGAGESVGLQEALDAVFVKPVRNLVLNLQDVTYLSSASLRVFLQSRRAATQRGGQFVLAGVQPYCREVLRISGLDDSFAIFETGAEALATLDPGQSRRELPLGIFDFTPGSDEPGAIEVLGHIDDVLESRVTEGMLKAKAFSAKGYSLGLGGLGASDAEVMPLLGEMITIGGTMVWLPTDGKDTPDFMIPKGDSELVKIRTAFNASLAGAFNEFVHFRAASAEGASLTEFYRALFDLAKERRPDFRGAIGIAMRADVSAAYGSGVTKSPIAANKPANGKQIIAPENFAEWFEFDTEPKQRGVTGLISGVGVDLRADLSVFDAEHFAATFYRNPANQPALDCLLHNHGVFFDALPFPDPPRDLHAEIQSVVEEGNFVDMRHLLDRTAITRALAGLIYVQDFRPDAESA